MFKIVDAFGGVLGDYDGGVKEARLTLANWRSDGERISKQGPDEEGHIFLNLVDASGEPGDIFAVVMPDPVA